MTIKSHEPYLDWIDLQYPRMVELLEQWSSINSGSHHLAGLEKMRLRLVDAFGCLGGRVHEHPLSARRMIDEAGRFCLAPSGTAISIIKRPEAEKRLLFCGHYDTVYGETDPFQTVTHLPEGNLKGPGVADMKGGLIVMLIALEAFERSPWCSQVGWEIVLNPDEEIGSTASTLLLQQAAKRASLGFVFEPALDGCLVNQRKGSLNLTVVVRGKKAHAGRDFQFGRNAIYALSHFIHLLEAFIDLKKEVTINVGRIVGGDAVNVVPDFAMCRFNIRADDEELVVMRQKVNALLAECGTREGITFELHEDSVREAKPYTGRVVTFFDKMKASAQELGIELKLRSSNGVCDGNTLASAGLPTIDSLGPVGGRIHSSEEYIHLPSLVERARMVALFLMKGEYLWI